MLMLNKRTLSRGLGTKASLLKTLTARNFCAMTNSEKRNGKQISEAHVVDRLRAKSITPEELQSAFFDVAHTMSFRAVTHVLHTAATNNMPISSSDVAKINKCIANSSFCSNRSASRLLNTIRAFTEQDENTDEFVKNIADGVLVNNMPRLSSIEMGASMYGIGHLKRKSVHYFAIVALLASKIHQASEPYRRNDLFQAMCAVRNMSTDSPEERDLLGALAAQIDKCNESFYPWQLAMAVSALPSLSPRQADSYFAALCSKILSCEEQFNKIELCTIVYGMRNLHKNHDFPRRVLPHVIGHLKSDGNLSTVQVAMGFYGLKKLPSSLPGVGSVISILNKDLLKFKSIDTHLSCMVLNGLQKQRASDDVLETISCITKHLQDRKDMNCHRLSMCYYGLQTVGVVETPVRSLLALLNRYLRDVVVDNVAVENILYAVKNMHNGYAVVSEVLAIIAEKTRRISALRPQNISGALYGLQKMNFSAPEMENVLAALTCKLRNCSEPFKTGELAMMLYSLHNATNNESVLNLVREMPRIMDNMVGAITDQEIAMCFYGLLHTPCAETERLVDMLIPRLLHGHRRLDGGQVSMIISGMRNIENESHVRTLLSFLETVVPKITFDRQTLGTCLTALAHIGMYAHTSPLHHMVISKLPVVQNDPLLRTAGDCNSGRNVLRACVTYLHNVKHISDSDRVKLQNAIEFYRSVNLSIFDVESKVCAKYFNKIRDAYVQSPGAEVSMYTHVDGFDADIILHLVRDGVAKKINIEIDGPHHDNVLKRRYCKDRDEFFLRLGYNVIRMNLQSLGYMSTFKMLEHVEDEIKKVFGCDIESPKG